MTLDRTLGGMGIISIIPGLTLGMVGMTLGIIGMMVGRDAAAVATLGDRVMVTRGVVRHGSGCLLFSYW